MNEKDFGLPRVRSDASTSSVEIDQVLSGQNFSVIKVRYGWYMIEYLSSGSELSGWIKGECVV